MKYVSRNPRFTSFPFKQCKICGSDGGHRVNLKSDRDTLVEFQMIVGGKFRGNPCQEKLGIHVSKS